MRRRILIDPAPLKESRDFRLLFCGQLVSVIGTQLTVVAIPYQIYSQTHSSFQVGAISIVQLVPLVVGSLVGGSVGEAIDRRLLLRYSSVASSCASAGLAANALSSHPSIPALYVISAVAALFAGFSNPSWSSVVRPLVGQKSLVAALSFLQALFQLGAVVGPAAAGLLIGRTGVGWVYVIDAVSFLGAIVVTTMMRPIPPEQGAAAPGLRSIADGVRFLRGRQVMQGAYLIDINAMVFGMPRALFPAIGLTVLHGGPSVVGYLYAAPGAGALVGALTTGWVARLDRQGLGVIVAVASWGVAIAAFGFTHILWLALVLLCFAGWADVISAVLRNTILHSVVPERLRSRIVSIQLAVVQGGPRVGDLEAGGVASLAGIELSVVSGGLLCVLGAGVLAVLMPVFRKHRSGDRPYDEEIGPPEPPLSGGAGLRSASPA
ncbi:MAG: MFS transporter [Acidimicrobiales bacterium]